MTVLATNRGHSRSAHSRPTEQLTRFVVVCAARTGSTMLCHMLNSHPSILCHGEVLGGGLGKSADRLVDVDYDTDSAFADQLEALRDGVPIRDQDVLPRGTGTSRRRSGPARGGARRFRPLRCPFITAHTGDS